MTAIVCARQVGHSQSADMRAVNCITETQRRACLGEAASPGPGHERPGVTANSRLPNAIAALHREATQCQTGDWLRIRVEDEVGKELADGGRELEAVA